MDLQRIHRRYLETAFILALILVAALIRIQGLGTSFYGDEVFHVVTAASLNAGDGPRLAESFPYLRALPYTHVVAAAFQLFGESEWAARLPSLVASLGCILLVYALGRRWFGAPVGMVAALVLAFEPCSVHFGSFARFYAPLQLAVLAGALSLDRVLVETEALLSGQGAGDRHRGAGRVSLWLAVFAIAMGVGFTMQVLTADLLLGFGTFAFLRVAWGLYEGGEGRRALVPEALLLAVGLLAAGAVVLFQPGIIGAGWEVATTTASWNRREGLDPLFYAYCLRSAYPLGWFLFPVGTLVGILQWRRAGLLATCLFLSPLTVHSLLFRPKSFHYLFPVLPFFFILAAVGFVVMGRLLWRVLSTRLPRRLALVAITLVALFCLRSGPWLAEGMRASGVGSGVDWRGAVDFVESARSPDDLVVGALNEDFLAVRYYLPSVEAQLATEGWLEEVLGGAWSRSQPLPRKGPYEVPAWTSAGPVLGALDSRSTVWVLARSRQFLTAGGISPLLHEIARWAEEIIYAPGGVVILRLSGSLPSPTGREARNLRRRVVPMPTRPAGRERAWERASR